MLPVAKRALIIGLVGPVIQVLGLLWLLSHLLLAHLHDPMYPRHLLLEGGFLTIGAGLLVSLICIPVALEVARSAQQDVELQQFFPEEPAPEPEPARFAHRRRAGAQQ